MDLGDTLRFKADLTDGSGALVNALGVNLTVTLPDGTTASPSVTNPPAVTGKYFADYVTTLASPSGRYVGQWLFTFVGGATTSYVETFDVGASLVTVDEAVAHLRATGVITSDDDLEMVQWLTLVATDAVERDLGRAIARRTVVETHNGGGSSILLRKGPVLSITSLTEGGVSVSPVAGYVLETLADGGGVLHRGSQQVPQPFWYGRQNVTVTYVVGYTDPPRIVRKVALNAVQGMWQASQQASHPMLEDFNDGGVGVATGALTPLERMAYDSLRMVGIG